MGFFDSVRRNMPGSPKSVAKHLLKHYLEDKTKYPQVTEKQIFRKMLQDRNVVMKNLTDSHIEHVVSKCDTLVELTMEVIAHENPAAASPIYVEETVLDILNFFSENAPMEAKKYAEDMKKNPDKYE